MRMKGYSQVGLTMTALSKTTMGHRLVNAFIRHSGGWHDSNVKNPTMYLASSPSSQMVPHVLASPLTSIESVCSFPPVPADSSLRTGVGLHPHNHIPELLKQQSLTESTSPIPQLATKHLLEIWSLNCQLARYKVKNSFATASNKLWLMRSQSNWRLLAGLPIASFLLGAA